MNQNKNLNTKLKTIKLKDIKYILEYNEAIEHYMLSFSDKSNFYYELGFIAPSESNQNELELTFNIVFDNNIDNVLHFFKFIHKYINKYKIATYSHIKHYYSKNMKCDIIEVHFNKICLEFLIQLT